MGDYLHPSDVPGVRNADELIAELEADLALSYPRLSELPPDRIDLLRAILKPIIRRWGDLGTGVVTKAGPFEKRAGSHVLLASERRRITSLLADVPVDPSGPLGSFPEPQYVDDLFHQRRIRYVL